ncbi:MAG: hypothetical protein J07HQX50_02273 [Haloquadratum sp. J07HQX50]|nr:MAG: hypothetical protein J07HQX50_02273 [Haloquadratum sp. J07HQX50]
MSLTLGRSAHTESCGIATTPVPRHRPSVSLAGYIYIYIMCNKINVVSLRSRLASFPLSHRGLAGVSYREAQPVTNIESSISNPTRLGLSGNSDVSSISYSMVTWSVHVFRCFCKRSSRDSIRHRVCHPTILAGLE